MPLVVDPDMHAGGLGLYCILLLLMIPFVLLPSFVVSRNLKSQQRSRFIWLLLSAAVPVATAAVILMWYQLGAD